MARIALKLDLEVSGDIPAWRIGMPKDWMDQFLSRRAQQRADRMAQAALGHVSIGQIPEMFRRLSEQIGKDIQQFKNSPNGNSTVQFDTSTSGHTRVVHPTFPYFGLDIYAEEQWIRVVVNTRKYSDSPDSPKESKIHVVSTGAAASYYRMQGDETKYADVSDVSAKLLTPLLEFIDS